jgi:hypothetical protein
VKLIILLERDIFFKKMKEMKRKKREREREKEQGLWPEEPVKVMRSH